MNMLVLVSREDSLAVSTQKVISWLPGDTWQRQQIMDDRLLDTVGYRYPLQYVPEFIPDRRCYGLLKLTMIQFAKLVPLRYRLIGYIYD